MEFSGMVVVLGDSFSDQSGVLEEVSSFKQWESHKLQRAYAKSKYEGKGLS